jgi:hypothetical protein
MGDLFVDGVGKWPELSKDCCAPFVGLLARLFPGSFA